MYFSSLSCDNRNHASNKRESWSQKYNINIGILLHSRLPAPFFRTLELKLSQQLAWPFPVVLAFIDFFILGVLIPNFILIASVVSKNAPAAKYMVKFIKNIRHQSLINPTFTLCNQHSRDSIKCFRISNSWCNPSVHTGPTV